MNTNARRTGMNMDLRDGGSSESEGGSADYAQN
jgi:hypothetical protein